MMKPNLTPTLARQRGIALPVMLLMMLMMLVTSIFLIKSINSTTLMTGNLAYESALAKQADLGLALGFRWLTTTSNTNKVALNGDVPTEGYVAHFDVTATPRSDDFWIGKVAVDDAATGTKVEYVIHRLCNTGGAYNDIGPPANKCVLTTDPANSASTAPVGSSLAVGSFNPPPPPQVHYVITSRIYGARGGNVMNQLVVLIGG